MFRTSLLMRHKRAQSTVEFSVLIIIIVAALLAMKVYLKRSLQGKLRDIANDIGEQYSPTQMQSSLRTYTNTLTTTNTYIEKENTLNAHSITEAITTENSARGGYEIILNYEKEPKL